jgi:hypothetical protein
LKKFLRFVILNKVIKCSAFCHYQQLLALFFTITKGTETSNSKIVFNSVSYSVAGKEIPIGATGKIIYNDEPEIARKIIHQ